MRPDRRYSPGGLKPSWSGLACLIIMFSIEATVVAEEVRRSPIRLEEITIVDCIQRPSLFYQINGKSAVAPLQPSKACAKGAQKSSAACSRREGARDAYEAAVQSWSKVSHQRRRIEDVGKKLAATLDESEGNRRRAPILDELVNTDSRGSDELPDLSLVPLDSSGDRLEKVFETLLQAKGAMRRCADAFWGLEQDAAKSLSLMVELDPAGQLLRARTVGDGSESKTGSCIISVLKALHFPKHGGDNDIRFALFYRPGSASSESDHETNDNLEGLSVAKAQSGSKTAVDSGVAVPAGPFSLSIVRQILNRSMGSNRTCASHTLRDRPGISGRVTVTFMINGDGHVSSAGIDDSTLPDAVGECLVKKLRRTRFPSPEGGNVPFTHTFLFHP